MKKFSKMLALGLALAMTFGMTVSAKESPKTEAPTYDIGVEWEDKDGNPVEGPSIFASSGDVYFGYMPDATYEEVRQNAVESISSDQNLLQIYTFNIVNTGSDEVKLYFTDLKVEEGQKVYLYHYKYGGKDTIELTKESNYWTTTLTDFSPFVLVVVEDVEPEGPAVVPSSDPGNYGGEWLYIGNPAATTAAGTAPVSPKTGETLPVAGMMAVLCLAGVVVCAKKARCNG